MKLSEEVYRQLEADLAQSKTVEDLLGKEGALKKLLKHALEQMLEAELTEELGYPKHAAQGRKSGNSRNGTSEKTVKSSYGAVSLEVPRDREGVFEPQVVKKYQRMLGEIEDKIISLYAKGMSTRDIQSHLEELYGLEISATTLSHITEKMSAEAEAWNARALEAVYAIVYLDAIHYKVRQEGKVVTKAVYTCIGIDTSGIRDLLGLWIGEREGASFWMTVIAELRNRGVQDILIACVDGLKGFAEALHAVFPQTEVQQCIIHQIRTSLRYIASKDQRPVTAMLRTIYTAPTENDAQTHLQQLEETWGRKYPAMIRSWHTNWDNLAVFFKYPPEIRRLIYTTNAVESVHRQFRKVTKTKSLFPHDDALNKILYLAYKDMHKRWERITRDWPLIASQLLIFFEERFTLEQH
jgi:transposase-like protein